MVVQASPVAARLAGPVRLALLTILALLVAHDAVYVYHYGVGHELAGAMAEGGHDAYWPAWTLIGVAAAAVLFVASARRFLGLSSVLRAAGTDRRPRPGPALPAPSYLAETARLWAWLWTVVVVLFVVQENVETLSHVGQLVGFEPIAGPETRLAIPILAIITLSLAAIGAVVRWQLAVLEARVRASRRVTRHRRIADSAPAPEWAAVHALAPTRWMLARPDAGRAPPVLLAG
jgi:hypothetical protein